MSESQPRVSVILPVYNGQDYLTDAIHSVLSQSFSDFELIVINDGSTDSSAEIIGKLDDSRVRFVQHSNKGLAATLNIGIALAKGEYIARQDQDDVCFPSRFQKQVEFLKANPEVGMVGTAAEIWVGNEPSNRYLIHPTDNASIKFGLLFDNLFVHSSVMIRREVFEKIGGYAEDPARQPPEDYELWSRVMKHYKLANLSDVLLAYREVEGSMSRIGVSPFLRNLEKISAENIAWASECNVDSKEVVALSKLIRGDYEQLPAGVGFAEMKATLSHAARKIAVDADVLPLKLNGALQRHLQKLRYHQINYRCGGAVGKMIKSPAGRYLTEIAKKIL